MSKYWDTIQVDGPADPTASNEGRSLALETQISRRLIPSALNSSDIDPYEIILVYKEEIFPVIIVAVVIFTLVAMVVPLLFCAEYLFFGEFLEDGGELIEDEDTSDSTSRNKLRFDYDEEEGETTEEDTGDEDKEGGDQGMEEEKSPDKITWVTDEEFVIRYEPEVVIDITEDQPVREVLLDCKKRRRKDRKICPQESVRTQTEGKSCKSQHCSTETEDSLCMPSTLKNMGFSKYFEWDYDDPCCCSVDDSYTMEKVKKLSWLEMLEYSQADAGWVFGNANTQIKTENEKCNATKKEIRVRKRRCNPKETNAMVQAKESTRSSRSSEDTRDKVVQTGPRRRSSRSKSVNKAEEIEDINEDRPDTE